MLKFFYSTQTCSTAIHIALEEANIPFEGTEVSWKRKVNVAELEAVNPLGQVPAIVHQGKMLNQCIAILEYVSDLAPGKKLMPKENPLAMAEARSWLAFIGADLQKSFLPLFMASRWTDNQEVQAQIKKGVREGIDKYMAYVDKALAGKDYVLGSSFSVVDAYLFTVVGWCKWAEIDTSKYAKLSAYMKRIYSRPAVQKVLAAEDML